MAADHPHPHPPEPQQEGVRVDAQALVTRLRQQRSSLQDELDILSLAYEDLKEQNSNLLVRVAELEDQSAVKPAKRS